MCCKVTQSTEAKSAERVFVEKCFVYMQELYLPAFPSATISQLLRCPPLRISSVVA